MGQITKETIEMIRRAVDAGKTPSLTLWEYVQLAWLAERQITTPPPAPVLLSDAWQPIETAPKDGTPVLVYHNRMVIEAWYSNKWGRFVQSETGGHNGIKPEHWMPLPPPPIEQAIGRASREAKHADQA